MRALAPSSTIGLDPELAAFFLGRLEKLVVRQMTARAPHERAALAQMAFAVFLDCLDLGLDEEARTILGCLQAEPGPAGRIVA
jgi:putative hemolysin